MTSDKSNLVSEIRQLLTTKKVLPELLVDVAAEYAEACATVNERLSAVGKLLADGYRDEAIDAAEQRPKLLSHLQLVDFPERAQWNSLLAKANVGTPTELLSNEAEQLEQAYEEQRQLAPLMRQHRMLALSGAPLSARLRVLRRLAKQDPASPIWRDDIETFEHARQAEIQADIAKAKKKRDVEQLKSLVEEADGEWSTSLPKGLRESTRQAYESLVRDNARAQMVPIATELNDCLSAFDVHRGRRLRTTWQSLAETAQLADTDPLAEQTREAMLWLAEADQMSEDEKGFMAAVADLERAIEDRVSLTDLERHLYAVQKFALEMPPAIARRAHQYHASLKLTHTRRSRLRLAAMALGVGVVGVALFLYFSNRSGQQRLVEARGQMSAFVDQSNYDSAKQFFDGLPPFLQQDGDVLRSWADISRNHQLDASRIAEFEKLVSKIKASLFVDDEIDPAAPLGPNVDQAIGHAAEFASSPEESAQIQSLQSRVKVERIKRQSERNEKFNAELGKLTERLRILEQGKPDLDELKSLRSDSDELQLAHQRDVEGLPAVAPSILSQATNLINRIDSKIKSRMEYVESVRGLDDITQSVGDVEGFKKRLLQFAEQHPSFPASPDFIAVAAESLHCESYAEWRKLAEDTAWKNPLLIKGDRATQLLEQIKTLCEKHPLGELPTAIRQAEAFLQSLTNPFATEAEFPGKLEALKEKYSRSEYREQRVLVDAAGNFKYFSADQKLKEDTEKTWFYFYKDLKRDKTISELIDNRELLKCKYGIAGQAALAERLSSAIETNDPHLDRDEFIRVLIQTALENPTTDVPIDSIVQAMMVQEVFEIAASHSLFWRDFAEKGLKKLTALDTASTDWMEFENKNTMAQRRKLAELIDGFRTGFKAAQTSIQSAREQAKAVGNWREQIDYQWVGWTYSLEESWRIAGSVADNSAVFGLMVPLGGGPPAFQSIGTNSKGLLDPKGDATLKSGRPIFVRIKTE